MKVVYAGYDSYSGCLAALIGAPDVDVVLCLTGSRTEPVAEVVRIAEQHGIPLFHGRPSDQVVDLINGLQADLLVAAAYSYRLPIAKLDVRHAVNIHPSLLPHGRGPFPLPHLADDRAEFSGVTLHVMDDDFDTGPILLQEVVRVNPADGFDELSLKMFAAAHGIVLDLISAYPRLPQPRAVAHRGSYWPLHTRAERTVCAADARVADVERMARIFGMSGLFAELPDGRCLWSRHVTSARCRHRFRAGEIVSRAAAGWILAVDDGLIRLANPQELT